MELSEQKQPQFSASCSVHNNVYLKHKENEIPTTGDLIFLSLNVLNAKYMWHRYAKNFTTEEHEPPRRVQIVLV